MHSLLGSEWQLVASWNGLDHNVLLLDTKALELCDGTLDEGLDDLVVPARVDNRDAEGRAVMLLGGSAEALDRLISHGCSGMGDGEGGRVR